MPTAVTTAFSTAPTDEPRVRHRATVLLFGSMTARHTPPPQCGCCSADTVGPCMHPCMSEQCMHSRMHTTCSPQTSRIIAGAPHTFSRTLYTHCPKPRSKLSPRVVAVRLFSPVDAAVLPLAHTAIAAASRPRGPEASVSSHPSAGKQPRRRRALSRRHTSPAHGALPALQPYPALMHDTHACPGACIALAEGAPHCHAGRNARRVTAPALGQDDARAPPEGRQGPGRPPRGRAELSCSQACPKSS